MNKVYWSLAVIGLILILMTIGANYGIKPLFYTLADSTEDHTVNMGQNQEYPTRLIKLNQRIECTDREMVFTSAKVSDGYMVTTFKVKNISSGPIRIKFRDFQLRDAQGDMYNPEVGQAYGYDVLSVSEDLNPGVTELLTLVFYVAQPGKYDLISPPCDVSVHLN